MPFRGVMTDLRSTLDERIGRRQLELPVLPRAAQEVLRLASDDDCDIRRVADVVKSDPTLAAHVLRIVNSPLYRGQTSVVSLSQALARLGTVRVRQVMFVIACETRALRVTGREADAAAWLTHALDVACFAQEIARVRRQSVEEGFLCGLLHDVGIPVLWQAIADLEPTGRPHARRDEEEELALNDLHAHVGALVADMWGLPARVVATIAAHHEVLPPVAPRTEAPPFGRAALALADVLADEGAEALTREPARSAVVALELYPEEIAAVLSSRRATAEAA
jgi:putative nucleotidyltransferase with HDIG domain